MDAVLLTDEFNDLMSEYSLTGEDLVVVDLDAWATHDLTRLAIIVDQVMTLRAAADEAINDDLRDIGLL